MGKRMTPAFAHAALSFLAVCIGVGLCLFIFTGLAAMGHFWRMNARPDDEGIPPGLGSTEEMGNEFRQGQSGRIQQRKD
jgi:hypothetical protein